LSSSCIVDLFRTHVGGERSDGANLLLRHSHYVLRQNHKIRAFTRLDRAFDLFLKREIRVVDRFDAYRLRPADLFGSTVDNALHRTSSHIEIASYRQSPDLLRRASTYPRASPYHLGLPEGPR